MRNHEGGAGGALSELGDLPLSLTVPETAAVLRVAVSTVYAMVKDGHIRSVSVGRAIRIPRSEIESRLG